MRYWDKRGVQYTSGKLGRVLHTGTEKPCIMAFPMSSASRTGSISSSGSFSCTSPNIITNLLSTGGPSISARGDPPQLCEQREIMMEL